MVNSLLNGKSLTGWNTEEAKQAILSVVDLGKSAKINKKKMSAVQNRGSYFSNNFI